MALARSASGPGGLSINTSSANSLFGSTSTAPAAGGMFGNAQAGKPLFGAAATTTAPQTGGLFGSTLNTSQSQAGGLFGSTATTSQPQTSGLFGSTQQSGGGGVFGNTNTSQPAAAGGMFGSSNATSQPQQGSGLFSGLGSQPVQNQNQNQTGGGLFGNTTAPQGQSGGLFSGMNSQNQSKPASSLFGGLGSNPNQQPQQQQQQSTMFNQSQQPFGGLSNQQQTVPGVKFDMTNVKDTTRFNELNESLQAEIQKIDEIIQAQIGLKNQCEAMMPAHDIKLSYVPNDVEFCSRKLKGLEDIIEGDAETISALRELVKVDAEQAKLSFRAIDNLKLPPQYHHSGIWPPNSSSGNGRSQANGASDAQDIVGFFSSTADELATKLAKNQKNISDIELHLRGVEASSAQQINAYVAKRNGSAGAQSDEIQELAESLQDFERSILHVAGKVGSVREGVQGLQLGPFAASTTGRDTNRNKGSVY